MAKRRSNGEGMLRKRTDGRWELRLQTGLQDNGKPQFKYFYGKTQKEVKDKMKAYQKEIEDGLVTEDITFEKWATMWFESYKRRLEKSTQNSYSYTLRKLMEFFGPMKLRSIRTMHVEQYLQQMQDEGKSSSYLSKLRGNAVSGDEPCRGKRPDPQESGSVCREDEEQRAGQGEGFLLYGRSTSSDAVPSL